MLPENTHISHQKFPFMEISPFINSKNFLFWKISSFINLKNLFFRKLYHLSIHQISFFGNLIIPSNFPFLVIQSRSSHMICLCQPSVYHTPGHLSGWPSVNQNPNSGAASGWMPGWVWTEYGSSYHYKYEYEISPLVTLFRKLTTTAAHRRVGVQRTKQQSLVDDSGLWCAQPLALSPASYIWTLPHSLSSLGM